MNRSTDRILVTHQGTLPRDPELREHVLARDAGKPFESLKLDSRLKTVVKELVAKQRSLGIDLVNDGEQSKSGFNYYTRSRFSGFENRDSPPSDVVRFPFDRDRRDFPGFFGKKTFARQWSYVTGPLKYIGQDQLRTDIDNLKAALPGSGAAEGVIMAVAPGTIEHWMRNEYYKTQEEFVFALAEVMAVEYKAITEAGLILHIDNPDLADGWQMFPEMSVAQYHAYADVRIEALNKALEGVDPARVIFHVCWGSYHNPHTNDLPLSELIDLFFKVRAQAVSIEASNPRHEHEWTLFEKVKLPTDRILIPGVVGHVTDMIEHPELVAQRLIRYANLVGRENVMAGTDCGLGSRVGHGEICWAKLNALAEGARIASKTLWGRT
ncbi:MAG: cobalamin-independent methionine synthase II family protein [Burkholderiales bacterium]